MHDGQTWTRPVTPDSQGVRGAGGCPSARADAACRSGRLQPWRLEWSCLTALTPGYVDDERRAGTSGRRRRGTRLTGEGGDRRVAPQLSMMAAAVARQNAGAAARPTAPRSARRRAGRCHSGRRCAEREEGDG